MPDPATAGHLIHRYALADADSAVNALGGGAPPALVTVAAANAAVRTTARYLLTINPAAREAVLRDLLERAGGPVNLNPEGHL